ncbi:MAG: hypothetical protein RLZZ242_1285 [Bacteroidota bacterium]
MSLPRFLLADNASYPDTMYVLHTEYPRFLLNVANDEITWFETFDDDDITDLEQESMRLIEEALAFYDKEVDSLDF